jgi:single-stranded-DNA-specific exonuclease
MMPAARIVDVRGMGQESQHARFTLESGGARARAVAFRTSPRALESRAGEPHDVAVRLELNEWNGAQEARLVLRALSPTAPGAVSDIGAGEGFWVAFERELAAPLEPALAAAGGGAGAAIAIPAPEPLALPEHPPRTVRDRRGDGVAGVAGDLLASGEPVLVVCADVARRRAGLEKLLAGFADSVTGRPGAGSGTGLAVCAWAALAHDPALAAPYTHVVALDPPAHADAEALLAALPAPDGGGFAHMAWGAAERDFALAVSRALLDLRPSLVGLYRELRDRPVAGADLEQVLRGDGEHPRTAEVAARMIRVLREIGVVAYEHDGAGQPACRVLEAPKTALERSAAHRAYMARLAEAERRLATSVPDSRPTAAPLRRPVVAAGSAS